MIELERKLRNIANEKDSKLLPENIKKDVEIFGITGTLETGGGLGDVKLFETVEEMQADPDAKENDLAIVYRNEIQNWNGEGTITGANFPETVVLPQAMEDYAMVSLRSDEGMFDCWGDLRPDGFRISIYSDSGDVRIEYTSSDGITYTRTDGGDTYIDFGVEAYFESWGEPWNDALGYFFQTGGSYFEGLYQYALNAPDKNYVNAFSGVYGR